MNRFVVALVAIVGLVALSGWLGHVWPGLIAAAIAGTLVSRAGHREPVARRLVAGAPNTGAMIVVNGLGERPIEVIRRLRTLAGLTAEECHELAMVRSAEFAPVRLSFDDSETAAVGEQALTRLGARVHRT